MSGSQTHGFDVFYEISRPRFLGNVLGTRLRLPEAFRAQLYQVDGLAVLGRTGRARLTGVDLTEVRFQDDRAFRLVVAGGQTDLELRGTGLPLTDLLLRQDVVAQLGASRIELALRIDAQHVATSPQHSLVTITMDASGHTFALADEGPLRAALQALNAALTAAQLTTLVGDIVGEVRDEVLRKLAAVLFPLTVQRIGLPPPAPEVCSIGPRGVALKLLRAADAGRGDSLSFFLTLREGSQGRPEEIAVSRLAAAEDAALTVATPLLLDVICCLLPRAPLFLNRIAPVAPDRGPTHCAWTDGTIEVDAVAYELLELRVELVGDHFDVRAVLRAAGFGWFAVATFSARIDLVLEGEAVVPVVAQAATHVEFGLEWWVWLIAVVLALALGVIAFFSGGLALGLIVGAVFLVLEAILLNVLQSALGAALPGLGELAGPVSRLQLLPADLTDAFGRLAPRALVVDDVRVAGLLRPPQPLATVPGGQLTPSPPPPPPPASLANGAEFVSQLVPRGAVVGEELYVSITLRNSGQSTWTPGGANPYRLGSQNPQDNTTWGTSRVELPATVAPGATVTFEFAAICSRVGIFPFQWRMLREGVEWFGATTPAVSISVTRPRLEDL